ncbi:Hypothetical_protein [Hexamita inflata]|uniref:Hypothetical_protein n=1 Tax=Hexamita inflata TaxID=28002 RepID=A0AA86QD55_9EUKA|nr:Hypothetical protein HINF_LOCUS41697 [Hexamita inflata]
MVVCVVFGDRIATRRRCDCSIKPVCIIQFKRVSNHSFLNRVVIHQLQKCIQADGCRGMHVVDTGSLQLSFKELMYSHRCVGINGISVFTKSTKVWKTSKCVISCRRQRISKYFSNAKCTLNIHGTTCVKEENHHAKTEDAAKSQQQSVCHTKYIWPIEMSPERVTVGFNKFHFAYIFEINRTAKQRREAAPQIYFRGAIISNVQENNYFTIYTLAQSVQFSESNIQLVQTNL